MGIFFASHKKGVTSDLSHAYSLTFAIFLKCELVGTVPTSYGKSSRTEGP